MHTVRTYITARPYSSLVVLVIMLTVGIVTYLHHARQPTLRSFVAQYDTASPQGRRVIAQQYLTTFPVSALLTSLEAFYTSENRVCHTQAHPIGRAIYEKHQNFTEAIKQCGATCSYGCFHGVLMEMFKTDSDTLGGVIEEDTAGAYLAKVQSVARDLCTRPEVEDVVRLRYCYHGLGHVFASIAGTDLRKAVYSCNILPTDYSVKACASGVFMENFFGTSSASLVVSKGEAPCDQYPDRTDSCYMYKAYGWIKVWGDATQAMHACSSFGKNELLCIQSVAQAQSYHTLVQTSDDFERLCLGFEGDKRTACISGAFRRIIELNDGDDSDHACDVVDETYRASCIRFLHTYQALAQQS